MNTNEYLEKHASFKKVAGYTFKNIASRMECNDGFSMSVQAGRHLYSTPREDYGPYLDVEVGFPSQQEPLLMEYAEEADKPTATVYGYVPVEVVDAVIAKHGGLKE